MVVIRGRVIKGKGGYGKAPHGPEVAAYFKNTPVKGTLNIALDQPVRLRHVKTLISMFWPSYIEGIPCLITRTSRTPLHVVEVISDEQLPYTRGDRVTLVIPRGYTLDLRPFTAQYGRSFMALGEHTGTNTKFTEGCWARFILSGAYLYKTLSGKHISHKRSSILCGDYVTLVIPRGYTLDLPSIHRTIWKIFYGFGLSLIHI